MRILAIIPARYASTRFPGKPLAEIGGKAMLRHVYDCVTDSGLFNTVTIATDDARIFKAANSWNANVIMTSVEHESGTERCAEAAQKLDGAYDIIVNVQGDEPFISLEPLKQLLDVFSNPDVEIATLIQQLTNEEELLSPNVAKVVLNIKNQAMYFSRSPIPYLREAASSFYKSYWKHIGIYAFRGNILQEIAGLPMSNLEKAEKLEQLRWLENGYKIYAGETNYRMLAVDTPEDLEKAEKFYLETQGLSSKI